MSSEPLFTTRPRLLDLFCGAGGAAMGYHRAGFDVTGVDIEPQPRYPFTFHRGDALDDGWLWRGRFDAIHASPPCQAFTAYRRRGNGVGDTAPDLIAATRAHLIATGLPWVIENVPGAPLVRHAGDVLKSQRPEPHRRVAGESCSLSHTTASTGRMTRPTYTRRPSRRRTRRRPMGTDPLSNTRSRVCSTCSAVPVARRWATTGPGST